MAEKIKSVYICNECGLESPKWYGRCPGCGEWNTFNEEIQRPAARNAVSATRGAARVQQLTTLVPEGEQRFKTGLKELDRVLGGGIVRGGLMLIGGDPGIGKSTLLLQICQHLGQNMKILYVSGEESEEQIKMRADRVCGDLSDNLLSARLLCSFS